MKKKKIKNLKAILIAGILEGEIPIAEPRPYIYVPVPEILNFNAVEASDQTPVFKLWKFVYIRQLTEDRFLYELEKIET